MRCRTRRWPESAPRCVLVAAIIAGIGMADCSREDARDRQPVVIFGLDDRASDALQGVRFDLREARKLLDVTREALARGIDQARVGNRVSDIGHAVQTHVEQFGFSVVREFVGHGIGSKLHEDHRCPISVNPGGASVWCPVWCWPSSRWSTPVTPRSFSARTTVGRRGPATVACLRILKFTWL